MLDKLTYLRTYGDRLLIVFDKGEVRRFIVVIYNSEVHMLNRISLQYAPNANERFTRTIRKTHDARNERTIHERTNEMKRTNYTENGNKRTHDTRNERTIPETNARITIHERTNHWSVAIYYPMTNDPGSIEVQYTVVSCYYSNDFCANWCN